MKYVKYHNPVLIARELKQVSVLVCGSTNSSLSVLAYFWFQLR
jgi:hypothetical protein